MRLPVVPQLSTKNGTANQNARLTNVLKETGMTGDKAVIRPALVSVLDYSGIGAGLIPFHNTLLSIYDDVIYADNAPGESAGDFASPDVAFNLAAIDWSAATTYSFGNGVWYDGGSGKHLWYSLVDSNTNNTPPAATSTVSAYWTPSFPPAWNSGYTYSAGAAVHYGGYYWFSLVANNINNTPATGDYWESPNPPVAGPKASGGYETTNGAYTYHWFDYNAFINGDEEYPDTDFENFTVLTAPLTVDYLIVGGGGSWHRTGYGGGGGGGASIVTGHVIEATGAIPVVIGNGGLGDYAPQDGESTTFITTVVGGGMGGDINGNGGNGGCGGGGGTPSVVDTTTSGGTGSVGYNGSGGVKSSDGPWTSSGGGGGMGSAGVVANFNGVSEVKPDGGNGLNVTGTFPGFGTVSHGGGGFVEKGGNYYYGANGDDNYGAGGSVNRYDAIAGVVVIRYLT